MEIHSLHSWDVSPRQAAAIQAGLRAAVKITPPPGKISLVAGADVAAGKSTDMVFAGVVVMDWPNMNVIEEAVASCRGAFPYVPGLLSFREGPAVVAAFSKLRHVPDIVFFDGQGLAHPRRLGLASHLGLFLDLPTIGCAKSRLIGRYREPSRRRGSWSDLLDGDETIGAVLRTKDGVRPLFVSAGHRMDQASAVEYTLAACRKYRLPEPARAAHNLVARLAAQARSTCRS